MNCRDTFGSSSTSRQPRPKNDPISRRTYISCSECRKRKVKCSGERPSCSHCVKRCETCNYDTVRRRRGPDKLPGSRLLYKYRRQQRESTSRADDTFRPPIVTPSYTFPASSQTVNSVCAMDPLSHIPASDLRSVSDWSRPTSSGASVITPPEYLISETSSWLPVLDDVSPAQIDPSSLMIPQLPSQRFSTIQSNLPPFPEHPATPFDPFIPGNRHFVFPYGLFQPTFLPFAPTFPTFTQMAYPTQTYSTSPLKVEYDAPGVLNLQPTNAIRAPNFVQYQCSVPVDHVLSLPHPASTGCTANETVPPYQGESDSCSEPRQWFDTCGGTSVA